MLPAKGGFHIVPFFSACHTPWDGLAPHRRYIIKTVVFHISNTAILWLIHINTCSRDSVDNGPILGKEDRHVQKDFSLFRWL